ncbi:MAG: DUF362 domain-containing protein [Proteobacteria bacterium]|nr:DUF362 domain-containing protein [Pseudomonadota bacterium]MBU1709015.1 DUF362 domain-containing protein [Pseudomonadota bacterium]
MDRREFLKQVSMWSAGLSITVPHFTIISEALAAQRQAPVIAYAKGKDYAALVSQILDSLGGMEKFVKSGNTVVIKPNIGWDRNPDQAANTHPLIVKALVEHALDAGAKEVKVFDRTCNEARRCYVNSGVQDILKTIKSNRVTFFHPDERKYIPVDISKGQAARRLEIYKDALEADSYINVPIAKHHSLSTLTLGMKNSMGVLGGKRGDMHHDLGQKIADLATIVRPTLTVIDATRILLRNGPQGGNLNDVKVLDTIIASTDPVAIDAYATTFFEMKPGDIPSTVAAYKHGLGEMDLAKIKIIKT